jgi:hypothetical protein
MRPRRTGATDCSESASESRRTADCHVANRLHGRWLHDAATHGRQWPVCDSSIHDERHASHGRRTTGFAPGQSSYLCTDRHATDNRGDPGPSKGNMKFRQDRDLKLQERNFDAG